MPSDSPMSPPRCALRAVRDQRGNTLILMPVAVLIVLGLGALALDAATLFLGQRRLADLAAAVANDAIAGVDLDAFYDGATAGIALDPGRGRNRGDQLVTSQPQDRAFESVICTLEVGAGAAEATATCTGTVRPILAPFSGVAPARTVTATETAIGVTSG